MKPLEKSAYRQTHQTAVTSNQLICEKKSDISNPYVVVDVTPTTAKTKDGSIRNKVRVKLDASTWDKLTASKRFGRFAKDKKGNIRGRDKQTGKVIPLGKAIAIVECGNEEEITKVKRTNDGLVESRYKVSGINRKNAPYADFRLYNLTVYFRDGSKQTLG